MKTQAAPQTPVATVPRLVSAKELAAVMRVSTRTLYTWQRTRGLHAIRISRRCTRYDLDAALAALTAPAEDKAAPSAK